MSESPERSLLGAMLIKVVYQEPFVYHGRYLDLSLAMISRLFLTISIAVLSSDIVIVFETIAMYSSGPYKRVP